MKLNLQVFVVYLDSSPQEKGYEWLSDQCVEQLSIYTEAGHVLNGMYFVI